MDILTGVILLAIGLIACFYGKRLYRIILTLAGFAIGFYAVAVLLGGRTETTQIIGALVGGAVLAALFWTFYKLAYVLFGIYLGLIIGTFIINALNATGVLAIAIVVVLGLAGGLVGNFIAVTMIRLSTAYGGAAQAIGGLATLLVAFGLNLPLLNPTVDSANATPTASIVTFIAVVALGTVGFLFQMRHKIEYWNEELYHWRR